MKIEIEKINYDFSICKVTDYSQAALDHEYCFIGKTADEKSLVCISDCVPDNVTACDHGWKAFKIKGILDFSLTGILSEISSLLADNNIGIFAVSTYNTDYILTKEENYDRALEILTEHGYTVYQ